MSKKRWIGVARWQPLSRRFDGSGGVVVKAAMVVGFWVCELEIERESERKREIE